MRTRRDSSDDSLRQALLSPSSIPPEGIRLQNEEESPMSLVGGVVDASPSRSFLDTSFFAHLRADMTPRNQVGDTEDTTGAVVKYWTRGIYHSFEIILILAVLVGWPMGAVSYSLLQQRTDSTFHPVPNSPSYAAQTAFTQIYTNDWNDPMNPALVLVMEASLQNYSLTRPDSPAFQEARNFIQQLNQTLLSYCWNNASNNCLEETPRIKVVSYYDFLDRGLQWLGSALTAHNGYTVVTQIQYITTPTNQSQNTQKHLIDSLIDQLYAFQRNHTTQFFHTNITGMNVFQRDLAESTRHDIRRMDLLVVPLALILIGIVLPKANPKYVWIIPLVTLISTVAAWSMVMALLAQYQQITHFTPNGTCHHKLLSQLFSFFNKKSYILG